MKKMKMKVVIWMFIGMLVLNMLLVPAYAKAESGTAVSLPHTHTGSAESGGGCYTTPIYHSHSGSASSGGGCYTASVICNGSITQKRGSICGSLKKWWGTPDDGIQRCYASCNSCGQFWDHVGDDYGDYHYNYDWTCDSCGTRYNGGGICTKTVGYTAGCGKNDVVESYELSCGYHICGSMEITNQNTAYVREATLTCEVISEEAGCSVTEYAWSNGSSAATATATKNGTYTCVITYIDQYSGETASASASINVDNIDNQGPVISTVQLATEWTNESVVLTVTAKDDQSGLNENAYSWNGGAWQNGAGYTVTENGTYTVRVRDRLGNETQHAYTVSNIDKKGPSISANQSTTGESVVLTVTAKDEQAGLHENAYSWNGGAWQTGTEYTVTENGTYTVRVRDRLGNETEHVYTVSNIRKTETGNANIPDSTLAPTSTPTPTPTPTPMQPQNTDNKEPFVELALENPEEWLNGKNKILVTAYDTGSGLAKEPYSYDGGQTWTDAAEYEITESGIYVVLVRDADGNITERTIEAAKIEPVPESQKEEAEETTIISPVPQKDRHHNFIQGFSEPQNIAFEWQTMENQPVETEAEILQSKSKEVVQIDDQETPENARPSGIKVEKVAAVVVGTVASGGVFIFFVWCFGMQFPVYAQSAAGKYKRIGRVGLRRKRGNYQIRLGRMMLNRAETNLFKVNLGKQFAKKHGSELLRICANETQIDRRVDENVTFRV